MGVVVVWVGKRVRREHDADEGLEGEVGYSEDVEAVVGLDGQGGRDAFLGRFPFILRLIDSI